MKLCCVLIVFLQISVCRAQIIKSYSTEEGRVDIACQAGNLRIISLADQAIRVQYYTGKRPEVPELVFTSTSKATVLKVSDEPGSLKIQGKVITVMFDKATGCLSFADPQGRIFLHEKEGARKLIPSSVLNEPCFIAEQSFASADKEYLFGLGQFQDGHYNLKGVSRRLTQVNSQIALPFVYSDRGYGLLWHQYGLTDYNPADTLIPLVKQEPEAQGQDQVAEVTTTSGTQKISQHQSYYKGRFVVPRDGTYSVFLDLGSMGNRHFLVIDGITYLDQSNMWLPPSAGALVNLKAGEHEVQLICKSDNHPTLTWKLADQYTTFRSPHAKMIDYVVFYGPSADSVIATYRQLSGRVPMLPLWAYGFWQCRERYTSADHLIETVQKFRERKLPMDVIVQDWQYWGDRGWGVPQFDEKNYPDPAGFIKKLHDLHAHLNVSIWSNPDKNSQIGREFVANNRFIPDTKWLDYFNPETRHEYWAVLKKNMFDYGVDSWWMDAVEPENDALTGQKTYAGAGDFYRLTYPLMVSQAVYEGQRDATNEKRVCILTRSAFLGQQRYGIINWSGDIGGNWDTYRRQIVAGLNYSITGMPYWTTDIGGFFRPGNAQYTDENYHELLIRWYQWSVFNPVFRIHGYMSETEPWKFGQTVEENMRKMLKLRYRLLPYIYSEAWQITKSGSTLMRPMIMDFRDDTTVLNRPYQFMFGKSILVAPVTHAGITEQEVRLPESAIWYDFWTGKKFEGGQTLRANAKDIIPFFIKGGSIMPLGKMIQYAGEKPADTLEIRIYRGSDGSYTLYEDEGDHYNYEKGIYTEISFIWDDDRKMLTIDNRHGSFPGMVQERVFILVLVSDNRGHGSDVCLKPDRKVTYSGKKMKVKL